MSELMRRIVLTTEAFQATRATKLELYQCLQNVQCFLFLKYRFNVIVVASRKAPVDTGTHIGDALLSESVDPDD